MSTIPEIIAQLGNARQRIQTSGARLNEAEAETGPVVDRLQLMIEKLGEVAALSLEVVTEATQAANTAYAAAEPAREASGMYAQTTWGTFNAEAQNLAGGTQAVASGAERLNRALVLALGKVPSAIFEQLGLQLTEAKAAFENAASQNASPDNEDSTLALTDKVRTTVNDTNDYIDLLSQEQKLNPGS